MAALVAFLVYLPSLGGGFLYDDYNATHVAIRDLKNLGAILRYEPARPLVSLSFAVNYVLTGPRPWGYHLLNVLIHCANAALLASLFVWMGRRLGWSETGPRALIGACLFAVSPMAAETVAYVSSRSSALAALFSLASLRLGVDALTRGGGWRLGLAAVAMILALATKEEAVAVPLLLLLLDYFLVAEQRLANVARRFRIHLVFVGLVVFGMVGRRLVTGAWLPVAEADRVRYLVSEVAAFPFYFLRALVPLDPALYRGHLLAPWPPDAATLVGVLLALALVSVAIRVRQKRPEWTLAVAWMAACLAPSSSIVPLSETVVDHRAYLGMAVVCLGLGALWRPGRSIAAAVVLIGLAAVAVRYQWILADPVRAWTDSVERAPRSALARRALGEAYAARGDARRAEENLREAVDLDRQDGKSWTNLGVFYARRERFQEAEEALRQAVGLIPASAQVHENLGVVLEQRGKLDQAATEYQTAIRLGPDLPEPRIDLARLLIDRGDAAGATVLLDEASRLPLNRTDRGLLETLRRRLRDGPQVH